MIAANTCAAETLEQAGESCVYRIHEQPDPEKIVSLHELTDALSLPFAKGQVMTPHRFNELLMKVKDTDSETAVNELFFAVSHGLFIHRIISAIMGWDLHVMRILPLLSAAMLIFWFIAA